MSRIHGRNGIAYVSVDGAGGANPTAAPMAYLSAWSMNFTVAKVGNSLLAG